MRHQHEETQPLFALTRKFPPVANVRAVLSPIAANADPHTSHKAARELTDSGRRQSQTERVAALVRLTPGLTSAELAARHGLDRHSVAKRLSDALHAGLVTRTTARKCSVTGKEAFVWQT